MSATKNHHQQFNATAKPKRPIFYVIAIVLPFALLIIIEGLLRLIGFGQQYPLFIPSSYHAEYLQPNPEVVKRFFHQAEFAPPVGPDTYLFKRKKDPDSVRIVFMGGSTAAGFPYGRFGSPAGMLNQRIKAQFPNKNIEIISVAMASINTYALLDFVDEVIAIEPDAVLIYAGHNEYLGVMGVGSVYASNGSHAANLLFLKLKDLRLFQLIQSLYYGVFQNVVNADHSDGSRTVMASVAKEKAIPYDSVLFNQGLAQFEQNLLAIQSAFSSANIPLYLSTIASNEKDLAPFSSENTPQAEKLLDKTKARSNRRMIQQGLALLSASERSADLAFEVAHAMLAENDERAIEYFTIARDYDLLRFRAPTKFNAVIANAVIDNAAALAPSHVLVDSEAAIRADAPDGIIGSKHMLEHLHPTARGYFLIAEAFYQALLDNNAFDTNLVSINALNLDGVTKQRDETANSKISTEQAWLNMPLSLVDEIVGQRKIQVLTSDYPFTNNKQQLTPVKNSTPLEKLAKRRIEGEAWLTSQQHLLVLLQQQNNIQEAAKAAGLLFDALPHELEAARVASLLYLQANQLGLAEYYARQTIKVWQSQKATADNSTANYYLSLAEIIFKSGDVPGAIVVLDELLNFAPQNQRALAIKQQIQQN